MSEIKRVLAEIIEVEEKAPIEGADKIELIKIRGWQVVAQKELYQIGDLAVYFSIDALLPEIPEFEFLRERCYVKNSQEGAGFRIKTIKLRGEVSQGMLMPFEVMQKYIDIDEVYAGIDVTEELNVKKYEKILPAALVGRARGNFPIFIAKTDQERIQNFISRFTYKYSHHEWEVSLKLDGSSMTSYYYAPEDRFGVCSRNLDLQETDDNTFWKVARTKNLESILRDFHEKTGRSIAIQGELMGEGVQGNREKLSSHDIYVFDIWDIDKHGYMSSEERRLFVRTYGLSEAPVYDVRKFEGFTTNDFLELADTGYGGKSLSHPIREGLVFKSLTDPNISFKAISNRFLLKCEE